MELFPIMIRLISNRLPGFFDVMLIDAPCSGSGLFRKDPEAAANWSPDLVKLCSQRQQRILADAWDSLKEDGFLIYSTCSYSKEENEDILDMIFQQYSLCFHSVVPGSGVGILLKPFLIRQVPVVTGFILTKFWEKDFFCRSFKKNKLLLYTACKVKDKPESGAYF